MPRYKCDNCGQEFWDLWDCEGDACNRCDDGEIYIIEYDDDEIFDEQKGF